MLVATPGQTASYPLLNGAAKKIQCHTSSASSTSSSSSSATSAAAALASSNNNHSSNATHHKASRPIINKLQESSSTAASALMKTLSVRLNRGTEFLKGTVQKALLTTNAGLVNTTLNISTPPIASTIAGAATKFVNTSNYINNIKTTSTASLIRTPHQPPPTGTAAASAVAVKPTSTLSTSYATTSTSTKRLTSGTSSLLKAYTVPPTITHRYPEKRLEAGSADSLHKEMCHFKPIRSVPTTPWKCGSRSRGASIKMPKACLAATKFKSINCDGPLTGNDNGSDRNHEGDDDDSGDEQHSYEHLRPKPSSTLLTTIIASPSHQSAFVCLLAQMKNLFSMQANRKQPTILQPATTMDLHKTAKMSNNRGRKKMSIIQKSTKKQNKSAIAGESPPAKLILRNRKQPFSQLKSLNLPTELVIGRRSRRNNAVKTTTADILNTTTNSTAMAAAAAAAEILKSSAKNVKSKSKLKPKIINIVSLAQTNNRANAGAATTKNNSNNINISTPSPTTAGSGDSGSGRPAKRKANKRKLNCNLSNGNEIILEAKSRDALSTILRKSARLSRDCNVSSTVGDNSMKIASLKNISLTARSKHHPRGSRGRCERSSSKKRQLRGELKIKNVKDISCFSPPLTRARLKHMLTSNLNVETMYDSLCTTRIF